MPIQTSSRHSVSVELAWNVKLHTRSIAFYDPKTNSFVPCRRSIVRWQLVRPVVQEEQYCVVVHHLEKNVYACSDDFGCFKDTTIQAMVDGKPMDLEILVPLTEDAVVPWLSLEDFSQGRFPDRIVSRVMDLFLQLRETLPLTYEFCE